MRSVAEMLSLDGRVAVLTGGAGHIGLAIGEALVEQGATVVVVDLADTGTEARASALTDHGPGLAVAHPMDVAAPDSARRVTDWVGREFGRIDILVHNAALTGASGMAGYAVELPDQTVDAWNAAIAVNLTAAFTLAMACRPWMEQQPGSSIVNVSSIYGLLGPMPHLYEGTGMGNPAAYGTSKAGLIGLSRYLATVLAPRVRVNVIAPGGVLRQQPAKFVRRYKRMVPLRRMATEEDLKGAAAFLVSDAAAYVTGQVLAVDGGWTAW